MFESLRERITLRRIAAHLVTPLRICIPVYEGARRGPLMIRLGMIAYDLLSVGKTVPAHDMLNRNEAIESEPMFCVLSPPALLKVTESPSTGTPSLQLPLTFQLPVPVQAVVLAAKVQLALLSPKSIEVFAV